MAIAHLSSIISNGNSSGVTTSGISTTGASLIVVAVISVNSAAAPTFTDGQSNTWTGGNTYNLSGGLRIRFFYCASPTTNASHTFTASGANSFANVGAIALSGTATTSVLDQQNGNNGATTGTSIQPGSITPSQDNCIVIAAAGVQVGTSLQKPSGYSGPTVSANGILGYKIQTTAGAENPSFSWTGSTGNVAAIASFKIASTAAAAMANLRRQFGN